MKILVPIDSINELDELISAGADEFYGGFIPSNWLKNYGIVDSLNRRNFLDAQIKRERELKEIVRKVHYYKKPFFLTLNQKTFLAEQYPLIANIINKASNFGIDGLIVADLGLILFHQKKGYHIPLILSTMAQVMNSPSSKFYNKLGIKRMVLPRDLSLSEIKRIVQTNPSVEFEVFILIGKCFNLEGFCTYEHCNPKRIWPCNQKYEIKHFGEPGKVEKDIVEQLNVWSRVKRTDACGLCVLPQLEKIGVRGLKIVGRGTRLERKKRAVMAVKSLLEHLWNKKFSLSAQKSFKDIFGYNCKPANCYFPEIYIKNNQ